MDGIKAWLQDRKNLPIVVVGTVIIVVLVALVFLRMSGTLGGGDMSNQAGVPGGAPPGPGMPSAPAPSAPGAPPPAGAPPAGPVAQPAPGVPPAPSPGGVPPTITTAPQAGAASMAIAPMLPYRKDPFMLFAGRPKPKDALMALLPNVDRTRLAPASVVETTADAQAQEVLPPQPFRRMAGAMWNGKIAAIMETNGEADIVWPGMELTKGNSKVRVESIQPDHIILKTLDTKTPMTIKVNLAGSAAAQANQQGYNPQGQGAIYPSPGQPGYVDPELMRR